MLEDELNNLIQGNDSYQIQKIFIKNLNPNLSIQQTQVNLYDYFSLFGLIIDLKVLKNRELIRQKWDFRICDFQRRGKCDRDTFPNSYDQQFQSSLIRFWLTEQKSNAR